MSTHPALEKGDRTEDMHPAGGTAGSADAGPRPEGVEGLVRTTDAQREVWLGAQIGPEASMAYNESVLLRLRGRLDAAALGRAVDALVARHASLRATFSRDGQHMRIAPAGPAPLAVCDLSAMDPVARAEAREAVHHAAVAVSYSLEQGPLFQATLLQLGLADHELVLSAHHAVCDGWSWGIVVEELGGLYTAQTGRTTTALPPAPGLQAFAQAEALQRNGSPMQAHVDYWLHRFPGRALPVLELPTDRPRPAVRTFVAHRTERLLDRDVVALARKACAAAGTSLFAGLLGAFAATLHRLGGQEDLVVGMPCAGQLAHDMPRLVGHCVSLLPLRLAVQGPQTFESLMQSTSRTVLDALEHQALTYGALLEHLALPRDRARPPLVSVMFNLDADLAAATEGFADLDVGQASVPRCHENFELFVNLRPHDGGLVAEAQYNTDLFDEASIQCWLDMFESLLRSGASRPTDTVAQLDAVSPQAALALRALQPEPTPLRGAPFAHAAFESRAALHPDRPAMRDGAVHASYGELDAQANHLAQALRARGIERGQRVGLCLRRGVDMVAALLAVLKSGAAYVPLDPDFPRQRLDHYAEDAALDLLLTASDVASAPRAWRADAAQRILEIDRDTQWQTAPAERLAPGAGDAGPDSVAYVIYTSGSTGRPKGVCVAHRSVANLIQSLCHTPRLHEDDRVAAITTLSFDIAVVELLVALSAGAEVVMVQRETAADGLRLARLLDAEAVTLLQATPGTWQLLRDAGWQGRPGLRSWVGGEPVATPLALWLLECCDEVWNVYGPTETTVWSTAWRMQAPVIAARGMAIGTPIDNTEVWILDAQLQPCPIGVPGEICIGGMGVSLGYLGRPELNAVGFVQARILGTPTHVYRTGDRGRWRHDGLLEHRGRLDLQLKIRGYRIEPGEIEARCNELPGVAHSVVIAREDLPGDVRLVAYIALRPGAEGAAFDAGAVKERLRLSLPAFMLPQHIVPLQALPRLPNGKIDRAALPAPQAPRAPTPRPPEDADAPVPRVLAAMEAVLCLPGLNADDDFFAMGGHSLLASRLALRLGQAFKVTVPLRALFESPTARGLAAVIAQLQGGGARDTPPLPVTPGRTRAPVTPAQARMLFMEALHPGRSVYNAPSACRLLGELDLPRWKAALQEIVARQPALRTRMGTDPGTGLPVQQIEPTAELALPVTDLRTLPPDQREAELAERMQALADLAIDIHSAPMCHAALFRLGEQEHVFVFVPHHLVWDGWSFDLLHAELHAIYGAAEAGRPHTLAPLPATHGDYAQWLEGWMQTPEFDTQRAQWRTRLDAAPRPGLPLTDMPRRAGRSGQGGAHWILIPPAKVQRLRAAARRLDVTLGMFGLGIHALTMAQAFGSPSVVVAHPVRGRLQPETQDIMGAFNNVLTVPLVVDPGQTLPRFMGQVKQSLLALMGCQQVPFECLGAASGTEGPARMGSIYQSMFSFQDARERPGHVGSLRTEQLHLMQRGATDDVGIWLMDTSRGLEGALLYNADIYLRETGAQLCERFMELLERAADEPQADLARLLRDGDSPSAIGLRRLACGAASAASLPQRGPPAGMAPPRAMLMPEQAELAQIWADALGIDVDEVGATDNFFDLGGDSLLAQRAVAQAALRLGRRIEPRRFLFETLAQIASPAPGRQPTDPAPTPPAAALMQRSRGILARTLGDWLRKGVS